jgi:hypothetical protein
MGVVQVQLPDGTVLMHGKTPYDPRKAHEYYIRTRKLKGRKKATSQPFSLARPNRFLATKSPTYTVKLREGGTAKLTTQQLTEQKAYAAKRVADIKKNLTELKTKLREMVADAKAKKAKSEAEAKKEPTAAEKSKAARESKQYREKHQQEISTKRKTEAKKESAKPKPKTDPVAELEQRITKIQGSLTAAVERQRALTSATKNG